MIDRENYLDDYGTQVDPLFDMVDKLQEELKQLKEGIRNLKTYEVTESPCNFVDAEDLEKLLKGDK